MSKFTLKGAVGQVNKASEKLGNPGYMAFVAQSKHRSPVDSRNIWMSDLRALHLGLALHDASVLGYWYLNLQVIVGLTFAFNTAVRF